MNLNLLWFTLFVVTVQRVLNEAEAISPKVRDEHIVAASNGSDYGIEIFIVPKSLDGEFLKHEIPELRLSPTCSDECERLLHISYNLANGTKQSIIFLPLLRGLALLDLRYDGTKLSLHAIHTFVDLECSPMAVYSVLQGFYTLCTQPGRLFLYTITLDRTTITNSELTEPIQIPFPGFRLSDSSNFVYVNLHPTPDSQWIYFSFEGYLYAMNPIETTGSYETLGQLGAECSELEYNQNSLLLAHCHNGSTVYFNVEFQYAYHETPPNPERPYICPNPDIYLRVHQNDMYILYGHDNESVVQDLPSSDFHSGVCFSNNGSTEFAYIDRKEGVYVFDTSSSTFRNLSSEGCCQRLLLFDKRYLVVRAQEEQLVLVLDAEQDFEAVIKAPNVSASFVTLIFDLERNQDNGLNTTPTPTPTTGDQNNGLNTTPTPGDQNNGLNTTPTPTPVDQNNDSSTTLTTPPEDKQDDGSRDSSERDKIIEGVLAGAVSAIGIAVLICVGAIICWKCRKRQQKYYRCGPEGATLPSPLLGSNQSSSTIPEGDIQEPTPSELETAFNGSSGQNTETSSILRDQTPPENAPDSNTYSGSESHLPDHEERGAPVGNSSSTEDLTSSAVQCSDLNNDTSSTPQVVSGIHKTELRWV